MKQINFTKVEDKHIFNPSLVTPSDDYFDALIERSNYSKIEEENQLIGYACVNDKNKFQKGTQMKIQ